MIIMNLCNYIIYYIVPLHPLRIKCSSPHLLYGKKKKRTSTISSFVFYRRNLFIQVWNDIRVNYDDNRIEIIGLTIPLKCMQHTDILTRLAKHILKNCFCKYSICVYWFKCFAYVQEERSTF